MSAEEPVWKKLPLTDDRCFYRCFFELHLEHSADKGITISVWQSNLTDGWIWGCAGSVTSGGYLKVNRDDAKDARQEAIREVLTMLSNLTLSLKIAYDTDHVEGFK